MIDATRPTGSAIAALFESMEAPETVRVELIGGRIVMSPEFGGRWSDQYGLAARALLGDVEDRWGAAGGGRGWE
ncbi:hypothetical protein ABIA38_007059 [Embleya sp. AB8]